MNNVTKNNFDVLRLPREALTEDRGYSACATPFKALADVNDVAQWKNDIWGVSGLFDALTVELERPDGSTEAALGAVIDLPKQPNAKAFVIDWRSNLIAYGAGCYKVKVNWTIQGVTGHYYDASFDLLPYSVEASEGTVQLIVNYDDKVRQEGINYTGSGYYTSLRFNGFFGNEQLNSEHRNVLKSNNIREKIRNFSAPSYSIVTRPLNRCFTRPLKKFLLNASNIWVSDYNAWNHEIYRYFNCILSDAEGIEIEGDETYVRQFNVTLLDKQWVTESKYDLKEAQPPAITSIISQGGGVCPPCPDTNLEINSQSVGTFPSGATIDVQLTDGTDPITPEDVSVVGNTVTVEIDAQQPDDPNEWKRNPNWLPMPELTSTDKFAGLYLIYETEENYVNLVVNASDTIQVNWGDGSALETGNNLEKEYDYASISSPVSVDEFGRNYKQVIIEIDYLTYVGGTLRLRARTQNPRMNSYFADIVSSLQAAIFYDQNYPVLERIVQTNVQQSVNYNAFFLGWKFPKLQVFETNDLATSFVQGIFQEPVPIINLNLKLIGASTINTNQIGLRSAVRNINFECLANGTTLNLFMANNVNLQKAIVNVPNATSGNAAFNRCLRVQEIILLDASNITNTGNMFFECGNLEVLILNGKTVGFDISWSRVQGQNLQDLFDSLGTANGSQTITLPSYTIGEDTTIATSKGFTIAYA